MIWVWLRALSWCPSANATFYAAAGKVDITPDLRRETVWLAGYGPNGRRARGVHDPLYARALVVSDGRKTVALVSVDSIGIFREDVLAVRRALGWDGGNSYLFLASTHDHSAPDTLGLWGRFPGVSGVDRRYHRRLLDSIARLVRDASSRLREAEVNAASVPLDPEGLCWDSRDPVVIDPQLEAVQIRPRASKGSTGRSGSSGLPIATLVRWSCHAVVLGYENRLATADFPGSLCDRVESAGGGTCVFMNGLIGGHLVPSVDRSRGVEGEFAEARRIGGRVADAALRALRRHPDRPASGPVDFDFRVVRVPVENSRYLLFLPSLTFGHTLLDREGRPLPRWKAWWLPLKHLVSFPLAESERPWVETEASRVRVGPVEILGIPGEMFPELAIGGYDGRYRFGHPLTQPANPRPPDLARAPQGPYLRDRVRARHALLVGLANDELGYIVPNYDFVVAPTRSMLPKPQGHHYEETNSIGPSATKILLKAYDDLLRSEGPIK